MQNHTIVETSDCWIVGGKLIINKTKDKEFEHWFEQFIYDLKRSVEK